MATRAVVTGFDTDVSGDDFIVTFAFTVIVDGEGVLSDRCAITITLGESMTSIRDDLSTAVIAKAAESSLTVTSAQILMNVAQPRWL